MRVLEWSQKILNCKSMQIFFITLKGSELNSLRLVLLKVQTHPSFMVVLVT